MQPVHGCKVVSVDVSLSVNANKASKIHAACKLTDAGLFVPGHDAASWTQLTLEIRIDALITETDSFVRSANGYNTRHPTQHLISMLLLFLLWLLLSS